MNYTKEQLDIFDFVKNGIGNGIIDSVAGSGKTTIITESAKYTPNGTSNLLCAFNKKIALELEKKFKEDNSHEVTVKTINALGFQILKDNNIGNAEYKVEAQKYRQILEENSFRKDFKPFYDKLIEVNGYLESYYYSDDNYSKYVIDNFKYLVKERLVDINLKYRATLCKNDFASFRKLVIHFDIFNYHATNYEYLDNELLIYHEFNEALSEIGNKYTELKKIIDYTDMVYMPVKLNQAPNRKFDFVFIDECQDLSKAQFAITTKYCKRDGRILAVGDSRQSIYGYMGADAESFERVKKYTRAKYLPLTLCFRCPRKVIEMAKDIRTDIKGSRQEEGIVRFINIKDITSLAKPNDLIISRTKHYLTLATFDFISREIKVKINKEDARRFISELNKIFNKDELYKSIITIPKGFEYLKKSVENRQVQLIKKKIEKIEDPLEKISLLEYEYNYVKKRLEFLHKRYEIWRDNCDTIKDVLEKIKEYITAEDNVIELATIHKSKGLEADRVFILNYNKLPQATNGQENWKLTEEINLKYVAITRAKEALFLVTSERIDVIEEEGRLFDDIPF